MILKRREIKKFFFIYIAFFSQLIFSGNNDYIYRFFSVPSYSNYGTTGILQNPSARFFEAGSIGFSWTSNDPYLRGSLITYPFDWLEVSYQYVDINNSLYSDSPLFSGNQSYKDKSFDMKLLLMKERVYIPAVAVGTRDLAGTGLFSSEFIVASKAIRNFDISVGLGWGSMTGNSFKNPFTIISDKFKTRTIDGGTQGGEVNFGSLFSGEAGIFAGLEMFIPNMGGTRLKVEYDSTNYEKEGFTKLSSRTFELIQNQASKFNFGIHFPISEGLSLRLGYLKGNNINFGFSYVGKLGRKNPIVKKADPITQIPNAASVKNVITRREDLLYRSLLLYLNQRDFYVQSAQLNKPQKELEVSYVQSKYSSYPQATGRMINTLDQFLPDEIESIKLINLNGGMEMFTFQISRSDFKRLQPENNYKVAYELATVSEEHEDSKIHEFAPEVSFPKFFNVISPSFRSQIGGPDGFFFGDLRLAYNGELLFQRNLSIITQASIGIVDNFDTLKVKSNSVLPHVRTDIVQYLKESRDFSIKTMQLNYFVKPYKSNYIKFSAGIFEEMFGGAGFEYLYRPFNKNYAIGAEAWHVFQREYDQLFDFRDYQTLTGHLNFYYRFPKSQVLFQASGGKFLAKDSGIQFNLSRRFRSGLRMGLFFSVTDISRKEFGEGSFDKGFYFFIPIDNFFNKYNKGETGFGLRPITRDGAAKLMHSHHLWGVTDQASRINFEHTLDSFYE